MQKLVLEVCDANHAALCEPVFFEHASEVPMGVKQAVDDFLEIHDGDFATPLVITARKEGEPASPCFSIFETHQPAHGKHEP